MDSKHVKRKREVKKNQQEKKNVALRTCTFREDYLT